MEEQLIARRGALKYIGILTSSVAGREFLAKWLPSAKAAEMPAMPGMLSAPLQEPPAPQFFKPNPQFFKPDEFQTVELLTEMIIPTDDKPGAKEARVASFIDFVVFAAAEYKPALQREWSSGLALLDQLSQEKYSRPFREISATDRERLLTEMSLPEHDPRASHPGFEFYKLVKHTTVEGFYSSRVGLIDVLGYKGRSILREFPGCTHPEHQT